MSKQKTIEHLLGALSPEEKAGQLLVFGFSGTFISPWLRRYVEKYNVSGIRTSYYMRRFIRYLPPGSPGIENVKRRLRPGEKMWDEACPPQHLRASEYSSLLESLRTQSRQRKHGIPLHFVLDFEGGTSGDFVPPGIIVPPSAMGLGRLGDTDLIYRVWKAAAGQLKAIGFDWMHSPVLDVNTNPRNPEISTRAFGENPDVVTDCGRAMLRALADANFIGTAKHYPGRGESEEDAHFGFCSIKTDRKTMYGTHLAPYSALCGEGIVPAVMLAHTAYPCLDPTGEIATVSKPIVTGVLREELGFDGVITTDSLTMGGLMAKYPASEAAVRAIEAGADLVLLKDENILREEVFKTLAGAIRDGRLSEKRVAESLRRIWSLKWDYGLFADNGNFEANDLDSRLMNSEARKLSAEAAGKSIHLLRDRDKVLPLKKNQKILVIDRAAPLQLRQNDSWNYPGMLWEFMLEQAENPEPGQVSYVDYSPDRIEKAESIIREIAPHADVLVATALFERGEKRDTRRFVKNLARFDKPVVLISNNPYKLIVPDEIGTVVVSYSLLRDGLKAASRFLFRDF